MRTLLRIVDPYVAMLLGAIVVAAVLPATGAAVAPVEALSNLGIFVLFFLYGARLSTAETVAGLKNWKLQAITLFFTFVLFPVVGVLLSFASRAVLPETLVTGMVFVALLPSTVQSSVTFTSIAKGNVAASIVAASVSNLLGVFLTPLLVLLVLHQRASVSLDSLRKLALQLLLPFVLGQVAHRWLGGWLARYKNPLSWYDKLTIVLIVYVAFSAGMREHMWSRVSAAHLLILVVLNAVLLLLVMAATLWGSKAAGFSWPDRVAIVFAGSKKSMASGLPMATVLFPAASVGTVVLPLMLFHQFQLIVCAQLARRWSRRGDVEPAVDPSD